MHFRQRLAAIGIATLVPVLGLAQSPQPFPDFEAKRVKPPSAGATKRITVQIEERANPAVAPPRETSVGEAPLSEPPTSSGEPVASLYDWFWDEILTQTQATGPGRLQDAVELLAAPSGKEALPPPRLQELQDITSAYGRDILLSTIGTEVSPALVLAVIYAESAGNPKAVSSAGAMGLMQLMPVTVDRFQVDDPENAASNIKGGVQFLDVLLKRYDGDPILTLAGYNAGEGAVAEHAGVPPYPETLNYVPRVLSAYSVARGLCTTQPLLPSDPCVFAAIAN